MVRVKKNIELLMFWELKIFLLESDAPLALG